MKKGLIRILLGLLCLGLAAVLISEGDFLDIHRLKDLFDPVNLVMLLLYGAPGIGGIVLIISGLRAYEFGTSVDTVLHADGNRLHTVLRYLAAALAAYSSVFYLVNLIPPLQWFKLDTDQYGLLIFPFWGLSALCLTIYLLFFYSRKPSQLLPAAFWLAAAGQLFFPLLVSVSVIFGLTFGAGEAFSFLPFLFIGLAATSLLAYLAILTRPARRSTKKFRIAGSLSFLANLFFFAVLYSITHGLGHPVFNLLPIGEFFLVILPMTGMFVAMLISTVFLPLRVQNKEPDQCAEVPVIPT